MGLPNFLIIGAMKSGSTALWWDLRTNPSIFFPMDKEVGAFCDEQILTTEGLERYTAYFKAARRDQICGEASTLYTKRPTYEGVAERARQVLGSDLKLLYIIREPVARAVSHHYHIHTIGECGPDINAVVRSDPTVIDYSRYAMQLEPWLAAFGREAVMVIAFDHFISDRCGWVELICSFLGIEPRVDLVEADRVVNRSDGKPVHRGIWTSINRMPLYRNLVRPLIPFRLRRRLLEMLLPRAPARPAPPHPETVDLILDSLCDDTDRLWQILGEDQPWWDPQQVRREYAESWRRATLSAVAGD